MSTLADFNERVERRIKDTDAILSSDDVDKAIAQGVQTYSKHRPRVLIGDLAGDGSTYDFSLPSGWVADFSVIRDIEYPAGERVPTLLERDTYQLYQSTSALTKIRLLDATPASGETARVTFTAPHSVTSATSTIAAADEDAVADLGAAYACEWLSSHFSQQGDPTLGADTVDHQNKAAQFAMRARRFRDLAYDHLGIARPGKGGEGAAPVNAASAVRDWDTDLSDGQGARLTHNKRWR